MGAFAALHVAVHPAIWKLFSLVPQVTTWVRPILMGAGPSPAWSLGPREPVSSVTTTLHGYLDACRGRASYESQNADT